MDNSKKIGFWSVLAIVLGSQVGSGILILPASLAQYSVFALIGWVVSGGGALALALVFARLCTMFPQTGGPHVYVSHSFSRTLAFFTGWTYWLISWVSSTAVVIASVGYLTPFIGNSSPILHLLAELLLLFAVTALNLRGVQAAGRAEVFLSFLKVIPLLLVPFIALFYFDKGNFEFSYAAQSLSTNTILGKVTLLTLWGFIGLEAATVPAGSVERPHITIPRAIIVGTICSALLYFVNSAGVMGVLPGSTLAGMSAPYVEVSRKLFGSSWHLLIAAISSLICIGTLNAWVLTSGQIALGLAEDNMLPKFFAKTNNYGAPINSIMLSSSGIAILLLFVMDGNLSAQITKVIDLSVVAFLFIYLICSIGLLKLLIKLGDYKWYEILYSSIAILFCLWIIYETAISTLLISSLFVLAGLPLYSLWYKTKIRD